MKQEELPKTIIKESANNTNMSNEELMKILANKKPDENKSYSKN